MNSLLSTLYALPNIEVINVSMMPRLLICRWRRWMNWRRVLLSWSRWRAWAVSGWVSWRKVPGGLEVWPETPILPKPSFS